MKGSGSVEKNTGFDGYLDKQGLLIKSSNVI